MPAPTLPAATSRLSKPSIVNIGTDDDVDLFGGYEHTFWDGEGEGGSGID